MPDFNQGRLQDYFRSIILTVVKTVIAREIVKALGSPIVSTSIRDEDDVIEYSTDPELIHEKYSALVDLIIDGGYGENIASTIVDCTDENEYAIVRQGKGNINMIY